LATHALTADRSHDDDWWTAPPMLAGIDARSGEAFSDVA
jgi:hypothetical protein